MESNQNIVKNSNDKRILILTSVIIILLVVIIILGMIISKKEYKYCNNDIVQDKIDEVLDDNCMPLKYNEYDVYIDILSMNEPRIIEDSLDHHLYITGKMNISFKEENFHVVGLDGYCLGEDDEKYLIFGPKGSEISFNNGDTEYYLVESVNDEDGDVIYSDGTKRKSNEVDWKNVKIKSCKIDKLYTVYNKEGKTVTSYTEMNYEKTFN